MDRKPCSLRQSRRPLKFAAGLTLTALAISPLPSGDLMAAKARATSKARATVPTTSTTQPKSTKSTTTVLQRYPNIVSVKLESSGGRKFRVTVTVSSPYDQADRYADAWRVLDERRKVLGVRELLHDHATEQPFTRTLDDVVIPRTVKVIEVQGRDKTFGWGGNTQRIKVPSSA